MSITALLPTIGREQFLPRMLRSLTEQSWEEGDELLVVSDDNHARVHEMIQGYNLPIRHLGLMDGPHKDKGHTPRNLTMRAAQATHVWHIDDDDIAMPGALEAIRAAVAPNPHNLHFFRFLHYAGALIWKFPEPYHRHNLGTPCMVHPTHCLLGKWAPFRGGDCCFMHDTIRMHAGIDRWHDRVIYMAGPPRDQSIYQCYLHALESPLLPMLCENWHLVPAKTVWQDLANSPGPIGRHDCQPGWHRLANTLLRNLDVLDVGAGMCYSKERMPQCRVTTQDIAPDLPVDVREPVDQLPLHSYDAVTLFDVLEHVEQDLRFLEDVCRVAYKAVFLTTPNWLVSRARNPYHVREYTPSALAAILKPFKAKRYWVGNSDGSVSREVTLEAFCETNEQHLGVLLDQWGQ